VTNTAIAAGRGCLVGTIQDTAVVCHKEISVILNTFPTRIMTRHAVRLLRGAAVERQSKSAGRRVLFSPRRTLRL